MPSRPTRSSRRRTNKKWSPVLVDTNFGFQIESTGSQIYNETICSNSDRTTTAPTSTVIKCGNFKAVLDMNLSSAIAGSCRIYIMYVPQGMTPTYEFPKQHPEWILTWRGFEPSNGLQSVSMQSKLKRNLNSGDSIQIIIVSNVTSTQTLPTTIIGKVTTTYVCCAN